MGDDTWVEVADDSEFPLANLPIGVVAGRVVTRIGDSVVAIGDVIERRDEWFESASANAFLAAGPAVWRETRARLTDWLTDRSNARALPRLGHAGVTPSCPVAVGDYVDFYASLDHATAVGRLFRPDGAALLPNWRHLPVGYHGRAGSVVVSGTPIRRPGGLIHPGRSAPDGLGGGVGGGAPVVRQPTAQLDYELELGFVVGVGADAPIAVESAADHVFGVVLVNDWSARDIQAFEYQPLGPFLGKSFATTVSPWIVSLDALAAARTAAPTQDPTPDPWLRDAGAGALDIDVSVAVNGVTTGATNAAGLYWTYRQQLAHLTSNGASVRSGDIFATGTISGPGRNERGCLLESTVGGTEGAWLADGDHVVLRASAPGIDGGRIGFGTAEGTVYP